MKRHIIFKPFSLFLVFFVANTSLIAQKPALYKLQERSDTFNADLKLIRKYISKRALSNAEQAQLAQARRRLIIKGVGLVVVLTAGTITGILVGRKLYTYKKGKKKLKKSLDEQEKNNLYNSKQKQKKTAQTQLLKKIQIGLCDSTMIDEFLAQGAELNVVSQMIDDVPLIEAVKHGDIAIVKHLLSKNPDINITNVDGVTPLMMAVIAIRPNIFELLINQKNIDFNRISSNETVLDKTLTKIAIFSNGRIHPETLLSLIEMFEKLYAKGAKHTFAIYPEDIKYIQDMKQSLMQQLQKKQE